MYKADKLSYTRLSHIDCRIWNAKWINDSCVNKILFILEVVVSFVLQHCTKSFLNVPFHKAKLSQASLWKIFQGDQKREK